MNTSNLTAIRDVPARAAASPSGELPSASSGSRVEAGEFLRHLQARQNSTDGTEADAAVSAAVGALAAGDPANPSDEDAMLMSYARKWVSQTFFGTLLKQMRESPFKSDLFSGGRGGEAFGGMYDQHLADRMARGAGRQLAESIVRQIKQRQAMPGSRQSTGEPVRTVSIAA